MTNRFGVKILPREVILDTQGRAVEQTLALNNIEGAHVRVGRYVELSIQGEASGARAKAEEITKFVLYNPLIETFEIENL